MEHTQYKNLYQQSLEQPAEFWGEQAQALHWFTPWHTVQEGEGPRARWFTGGTLNVSYNCLDRHVEAGQGDKTALLALTEDNTLTHYTYAELLQEVEKMAGVLVQLGIKKGDRVALYLPQTEHLIIAMLACTRIGAIHVVVFAGFSATALRVRLESTQAKLLLTAAYTQRRGKKVPLWETATEAITDLPCVEKMLVWRRGIELPFQERELDWEEQLAKATPVKAVPLDSEDPLFILHTSGTTGTPKGIVHSTGGYLLGAHLTTKHVFDLQPDDIFWCTADPGWITGHSYIAYGPLSNQTTIVIAEGAPDWPEPDRWWSIIEKLRVTILYTAPTAIRLFRKMGEQWPAKHDLSSLRLLASVGEPLNPEAGQWYSHHIGGDRCPVVDTWWQTETGSHMLATLPGIPQRPGKAGLPFFGVEPAVVDARGREVEPGVTGNLILKRPWPSVLRGCWNNEPRYREYWETFRGHYWSGDLAVRDADGYIQVLGRADDVINIAGHRLGTAEVESALVAHKTVAEAAAVAIPDEIRGQNLHIYVVLRPPHQPSVELKDELSRHIQNEIGRFLKLDLIEFLPKLPKTRSGKIMRRVLRALALGQDPGDVSTLED